jgi:hypothetical protein
MANSLFQKNTLANKLMSFISSNMPYSTSDIIDNIEINNPHFKEFYKLDSRRTELLNKYSIAANPFPQGVSKHEDFYQFMHASVDPDKIKRLREYRTVAMNDIISDCLDNICDDFINEEVEDKIVECKIKNDNLESSSKETILNEFKKIVNYFDLENKGWEYIRNILTDGELYFEHIIHPDHKDKGILGLVNIPTEMIDPIFDNVQNMIVKGYLLRKQIIDPETRQVVGIEPIVFDFNQITYFHSHTWDESKKFKIPFIETARRAYKQLTYVEDAIVVHRLVNAPEKLVFNVDVGNLPTPQVESYLARLANNYWTRKTYDNKDGNVSVFNPQSMLDSFWFPKRSGSEGSSVQRIQGAQNLGALPDLDYFIRKIYQAMHVPVGRMSAEAQFSDGTEILREELRFAKLIIRLQRQFSQPIKDAFITHLQLRGLWEEYELKERDIVVSMRPPSHFHVMREQQIKEIQYNNYSALASDETISKTFLQKKELGWTDKEILANRKLAEKDAEWVWTLSQIQTYGTDWKELSKQQSEQAANDFDAGAGGSALSPGVGDIGGGSAPTGAPPEFGATPDVDNTDTSEPTDSPDAEPEK